MTLFWWPKWRKKEFWKVKEIKLKSTATYTSCKTCKNNIDLNKQMRLTSNNLPSFRFLSLMCIPISCRFSIQWTHKYVLLFNTFYILCSTDVYWSTGEKEEGISSFQKKGEKKLEQIAVCWMIWRENRWNVDTNREKNPKNPQNLQRIVKNLEKRRK